MEALRNFWEAIAPYFGVTGVLGFIGTCILLPLLRGKVQKASLGFDASLKRCEAVVKEAADKAAADAVSRIQRLSFEQSIQPLAESELKKITEAANEQVKDSTGALMESNEKIVTALAALGAFFEDSIVPDAKKAAFAEALKEAQAAAIANKPVTQGVEVAEIAEAQAPKKTARKVEVWR